MTIYRLNLPLEHEFTISRESISVQPSLIVELEHDGFRGYGEVAEDSYYGHTFESMTSSLEKARGVLDEYLDQTPQQLWSRMQHATDGNMFALSALDMAAHDLRGKRLGIPAWKDWGLSWQNVPESSYTIGIDTIEKMVSKLKEMAG